MLMPIRNDDLDVELVIRDKEVIDITIDGNPIENYPEPYEVFAIMDEFAYEIIEECEDDLDCWAHEVYDPSSMWNHIRMKLCP